MSRRVEVVIVGGGTAGWMAAAGLVGLLTPEICSVRLIESDEIGTVGVGEATLPQMRQFNDAIGIIETDMMRRTHATFKLGIEFVDWGTLEASYIHPFGAHGRPLGGAAFHHQWLRAAKHGHAYDLEDFSYAVAAARNGRFDFPSADHQQISSTYDYAYHLDASLYARYLRTFCESRGVRRTEGRVVEVNLHPESGDVASVQLASGELVAGDLFLDCSGFRALLIGEALASGWEDWSKWLPCDRALAVPCDRAGEFTPFTRSTAREAGWQWRIPLQHRTGNGYVFASSFIDADRAAEALMANLDGAAQAEPRLLRFSAGRRLRSWQGNCVAIGLASGFLEPLESTSIYLIQVAIQSLVKLFPDRTVDPALADEFNRLMDVEYERIRDFLILHYHANGRDDAELWRYCRAMAVPDSLRAKIELFTHRGHIPQYRTGLFSPPSWISVFIGQGLRAEHYDRLADNLPIEAVIGEMEEIRASIAARVAAMPAHAELVEDYCPSADPTPMQALA
ncbi:MAG: Tryptophan halogenase [uncultured Sphingomonas sp.]|uniref:Tryptophan halogenase n=1 Tax=uncultured Sphingomonas sp. TaxID=158754 RepID=A0A6J4TJF5_9SPHN|nr:tryptophan halogenase family protein [uncultured Sphingomonas sp.]CAA9525118.1 MAG: Tryptophan halogenase [uncultured Sphingomonas sp.]